MRPPSTMNSPDHAVEMGMMVPPEQPPEAGLLAWLLAGTGMSLAAVALLFIDSNGHFIGNDRRDRFGGCVPRDGDHVQPHGTDAGHGLQLSRLR